MKKYTSEKEADLNKRYSGVDTSVTVKEDRATHTTNERGIPVGESNRCGRITRK